MRASLEIHVPISPTPLFFNRMHYLAASLGVYGGPAAEAPLVITVGDDSEPFDLRRANPWSRRYPIEWRWLDRALYRRFLYWGTRQQRFRYDYQADVVLFLDPDVLVVGPFVELVEDVARTGSFTGITAHTTPVRDEFTWERLFALARLGPPLMQCEHSGFGVMFNDAANRYCPPYFNLGVLACPASVGRAIGSVIMSELETIFEYESFFRAQASLTLAIVRLGIPWQLMSLKYNFPNDPRFLARYRGEFEDKRLVHYLRKQQFDKEADFGTPAQIGALINREGLNEVNRAFLDRLRPVHARVLDDLA